MRINKKDIPAVLSVPGATARQVTTGTDLAAEYFSLAAGTDIKPLLAGLDGDLCQVAHWGHVLDGALVVTFADGTEERPAAGDCFHWPPGHSVRVEADAEVILFSPLHDHRQVLDHMGAKLASLA